MSFNVTSEVRPRRALVVTDVTCDRCHQALPEQRSIPADGSLQFDNNLVLELSGGYGMFCDPSPLSRRSDAPDPEYTKVLCHECAHEFAAWLGIDVSNWHTHDPQSGQHADHHARARAASD